LCLPFFSWIKSPCWFFWDKVSLSFFWVKISSVPFRVDFNCPQDKKTGAITNPARIVAALPTIKYALAQNAKSVVLSSHLGRPDGRRNEKFSLKPVAEELEKQLGK
jgi:phosphoglycerate kinase